MTERTSWNPGTWILLAITVIGLTVTVVGYGNLISSNCEASSASEFFSSVRAFHTRAGC